MFNQSNLQSLREISRQFWKDHRFVVLGLLAVLVVIEIVVAYSIGKSIESAIRDETASRLVEAGLNRIEPRMSGRDVTLEGQVSSGIARDLAVKTAESVTGIRAVGTVLDVVPLRLPHIRMTRPLDGSLILEGELPTQDLVTRISELAEKAITHDGVQAEIAVDPEVTVPVWLEALDGIVQEGNLLQGMEILVGAGQVILGGLLDSQADYNVLVRRVDQFARDHALKFVNKIGIKPAQAASANRSNGHGVEQPVFRDSSDGDGTATPATTEKFKDGPETGQRPPLAGGGVTGAVDAPQVKTENVPPGDLEASNVEGCQVQVDQAIASNPITFAPKMTELSVDNYTNIDKIVEIVSKCPTLSVEVAGHTDSRGDPEANLALSGERASNVMRALVERGIEQERIRSTGYGSARPVASNETPEGRGLNRRIEIVFAPRQ